MPETPILPDGSEWLEHDTRGYLDGGPMCDKCGACECEPTCGAECHEYCMETCHESGLDPAEEPESLCIGLSHGWTHLDSGEFLCDDCFACEEEKDK